MEDFSVVICAYTEKRWSQLVAAVESVQQQTAPAKEVIVVIDHNPDLLEQVRLNISGVMSIENTEQRGLSGARNSGISVAQGNIIAFMDEDAIAAPDWLAILEAGFDDHRVLGVGGAIEPLWPDTRPSWFPEEFDWVIGCTYQGMPKNSADVRNLIGCNMSFRREVFEGVGGFRGGIGRVGTLPVGCEETELCIRALKYWPDCVFRYEPLARVNHRISDSRISWRYFFSRCYFEGRSKAIVSRMVGSRDGLTTERAYTLSTLPRGALKGISDTFSMRDRAGLIRAGAIITGLLVTTSGYITGRIKDFRNSAPSEDSIRAQTVHRGLTQR